MGAGNAFAQQQMAAGQADGVGAGDGMCAAHPLADEWTGAQLDAGTPVEMIGMPGATVAGDAGTGDAAAAADAPEAPGTTTGDLTIEPWTMVDGGTRTTVGVGENMQFHCSNAGTSWSSSGGTDGATTTSAGSADMFNWTAGAVGSTVTITVTKGSQTGTIAIRVVEPTGIAATRTGGHDLPGAGAGMTLSFSFNPSGPSFANCQWYEEPKNASNLTGYFQTHTPPNHDAAHGAGRWVWMNQATDIASFGTTITPYAAGSYDWEVPTKWRVAGTGGSNDLVTTTQHHEIKDATGTAFISKHGVTSPDQAP